jgi:hypothetical protein
MHTQHMVHVKGGCSGAEGVSMGVGSVVRRQAQIALVRVCCQCAGGPCLVEPHQITMVCLRAVGFLCCLVTGK